jgi:integrase
MRLIDLRAANLQAHYNALDTTPHNIFELHRILRTFFRYCVKADILMKSPLLAVELPKIPQKTTPVNEALKDSDVEKLIKATKEDISSFPYLFLAFTGLRVGELMALMYKDIDFSEGLISVNKSLKYEPHPVVSDTKTPASIRRVPVLDEIKPLLLEHIKAIKLKNKNIIRLDGNFILFPSEEGTYRRKASLLEGYKALCKRLDIRQGKTLHSLRHTFCTILARQGVSLLDASRLMGHSNVGVTAKIYSHVTDNDKKNAVRKLSAYFV